MTLTGFDEYPFHQIGETFAAVANSDPRWNDGHYVCVADARAGVCLTSNLRLYPNTDVLDGFVCIRRAGRQRNARFSRRLSGDRDRLAVGPLRIEVVEPMRALRLELDENEHGVACDVLCRGATLPHSGPPEIRRADGRLVSQRVTYELAGPCTGWVQVAGERVDLRDAAFFRNHSWGIQPGRGGPQRHAAPFPVSRRAPGVRQWVLFAMPDHAGFYFLDPSGRSAAGTGAVMYADRVVPVAPVDSRLEFYDGGRRLRRGWFRLDDAEGVGREYEVEDFGWVYCQGGGYFGGFDDGLGQGVYRGEFHSEGEVWDVSHPTRIVAADGRAFEFEHAWAESFTTVRSADGSGLAHVECVVIQA